MKLDFSNKNALWEHDAVFSCNRHGTNWHICITSDLLQNLPDPHSWYFADYMHSLILTLPIKNTLGIYLTLTLTSLQNDPHQTNQKELLDFINDPPFDLILIPIYQAAVPQPPTSFSMGGSSHIYFFLLLTRVAIQCNLYRSTHHPNRFDKKKIIGRLGPSIREVKW